MDPEAEVKTSIGRARTKVDFYNLMTTQMSKNVTEDYENAI